MPGSGKSHYASSFSKTNKCHIVDCDIIWKYKLQDRSLSDAVSDNVIVQLPYYDHIIIDGLVTTNDVAINIFTAIVTHPLYKDGCDIIFEIVWWEVDIEACLHNDRGRRVTDSRITIENMLFEEPNQELIKDWKLEDCIIRKDVVKKPMWKVWSQELGLGDSDKIKSESWSLCGTYGTCWDDIKTVINASPQPTYFKAFDSCIIYRKLYFFNIRDYKLLTKNNLIIQPEKSNCTIQVFLPY